VIVAEEVLLSDLWQESTIDMLAIEAATTQMSFFLFMRYVFMCYAEKTTGVYWGETNWGEMKICEGG
jgi:hypothetical protein